MIHCPRSSAILTNFCKNVTLKLSDSCKVKKKRRLFLFSFLPFFFFKKKKPLKNPSTNKVLPSPTISKNLKV